MENEEVQSPDATATTDTGTTTDATSDATNTEGAESIVPEHSFEFTNDTTGEHNTGTYEFTGATSEQADLINENLQAVATKLDTLIEQTVPVPTQNVSVEGGMTAEQAQTLIDAMNNLDHGLYFLVIFVSAFFIWQIFKVLYQFIGGMIFGRL